MTHKAAIYARISRDKVGAGLGVERQQEDCRALAERLGVTVVATYVDNDLSAYSGKPRPGYRKMLAEIRDGSVDIVLAWHTDRLHRSPVELEEWISACDPRGVAVHTVKAGLVDLSTPSGRAIARTLGAWAKYDVEDKIEKLMAQKKQARTEGKWLGGRRPFGYEADGMTVRPDEADLILAATKALLAGDSLHGLARAWNAAGVTTATGSRWDARNLRRVLERPRNAGLTGNIGRVAGEASWPAIVPRETWEALSSMLSNPARRTHQSTSRKLLGSYVYVCAECGAKITSGGHGANGQDRYACQRNHVRRAAKPIDDLVRTLVVAWLRKHGVKLIPHTEDTTFWRDRLDVLEARAAGIASLLADVDSGMTMDQFRESNGRIQQEIREVRVEIARRTQSTVLEGVADAADPGQAFLAASMERQRSIIDEVCVVAVRKIGQGRHVHAMRPDESLRIDWKPLPG